MTAENGIYEFTVTPAAQTSAYLDFDSPEQTDDEGQLVHRTPVLRNLTINNQGNADCRLRVNDNKAGYPIPSNTIQTFEYKNIRNLKIDNLDASNAADVKIVADNQETVKSLLKQIAGVRS